MESMQEKQAHLESLQMPTILLNGSDPVELAQKLEAAYLAINEACRALNECTPHGRDYVSRKGDGYAQAYREHMARGRKLCDVMDELCYIAYNIRDQNEVRK